MIIGFDVGGTNARGILMDANNGAILSRVSRPSDGPGPVLLEKLVAMVNELGEGVDSIDSIGLGIAGLAHSSGVVRYSPNLPELIEYPMGINLAAETGISVTMNNDASAGAWAEAKLGAGKGVDDLIYVALGTGIGTGIVAGGQLLLGANGFAGECGHMVVDFDGPEHITGQKGPWEYFASGNALGRLGREAAQAGDFDLGATEAGSIEALTGFDIATGVRQGNEQAAAIFDVFCREVARGIANLVIILDPQRIVLGGGLTDIGEPLRSGVDSWLQRLAIGQANRPVVEVVMAALGSDSATVGAALLGRVV